MKPNCMFVYTMSKWDLQEEVKRIPAPSIHGVSAILRNKVDKEAGVNNSDTRGGTAKYPPRHKPEIKMDSRNYWVIVVAATGEVMFFTGTRKQAERERRDAGQRAKCWAYKRLATTTEIKHKRALRGIKPGEEVITWIKGLYRNLPQTPEEWLQTAKTPNPYEYLHTNPFNHK